MEQKIIVGHPLFAFKEGGMERGILNIINHGDRERFSHVVICLTEAGPFAKQVTSSSCKILELRKKAGNDLSLPKRIASAVRRYQVGILHARGWPTLVETILAARIAGIRNTIYGFHGKTIEDLRGITYKRRFLQKMLIRFYARVVTLNRPMRAELAVELGVPEGRIHIIENGVATETFSRLQAKGELRKRFDLPNDRFIFGNVARLDAVKNHDVMFRAFGRLQRMGLKPILLLVGDGPNRSALEQEIRQLPEPSDVRLVGFRSEIPELLNCMDAYIQSSYYEGFSNTILEAMSCGLPVIATNVGGTSDLFSDGHEGFLFHPEEDDKLASLMLQVQSDSALRYRIGNCARSRVVEQFSVEKMVRRYEAMYLEMARDLS